MSAEAPVRVNKIIPSKEFKVTSPKVTDRQVNLTSQKLNDIFTVTSVSHDIPAQAMGSTCPHCISSK